MTDPNARRCQHLVRVTIKNAIHKGLKAQFQALPLRMYIHTTRAPQQYRTVLLMHIGTTALCASPVLAPKAT